MTKTNYTNDLVAAARGELEDSGHAAPLAFVLLVDRDGVHRLVGDADAAVEAWPEPNALHIKDLHSCAWLVGTHNPTCVPVTVDGEKVHYKFP